MRNGLQNCCTRRTLCTAVFNFIFKKQFCLCLPQSISRQSVKSAAYKAMDSRSVRKTGVQKRTQEGFSVPSRTQTAQFCSPKINACEIREDFRRRSNTMHHPVIYRNAKLLYRTVAYPTIPYVLTQNDESDRVLLRTGYHGRKSEQICGTADFSLANAPGSPIRKPITRKMEVKS